MSFASLLTWFWLLRRYLASRLGVFSFLTPLFGVLLGVLLLGESLEPHFVAGSALVLAGIGLVGGHAVVSRRWLAAARAPTIGVIPLPDRTRVKHYDIEVQRLKSMRHDKGLIELGVDVLVLPRTARDDPGASSSLRLPVEHARSLLILLKQQIAELDKLQPRSRRSGRA